MLQLLEWHHKWRRRYHLCYRAIIVLLGAINLPKTIQFVKTIDVGIMDTYVETSIPKQGYEVQNIEKKIPSNRYKPKVALEDKVYRETYYKH